MFTKLQLVMLGVVVLQGAGLNAMDKGKSPRNPLSCSQEARRTESGDLATIVALKRPREVSKEGKNNTPSMYYPWPGGNPEIYGVCFYGGSPMAPYSPDNYYPNHP